MNNEEQIQEEQTQAIEQAAQEQAHEREQTTKTFTQEEVERIIATRLKRKEREVEERLRKEQEQAQMSEVERLRAELEEWRNRATAVQRQAAEKQAQAMAIEALADAGVPAAKRQYALRMLEISDAISDDGVEESAIRAAVKKLLSDIPELTSASSARAGSEFSGQGATDLTEDAIAKMSPDELRRRWNEIQAFYSRRNR